MKVLLQKVNLMDLENQLKMVLPNIYEGEFKDDKQEGKGKEKWPDGAIYAVKYKNGVICGEGNFIWDNGAIYEGDFDNNQINGIGTFNFSAGRKYKIGKIIK